MPPEIPSQLNQLMRVRGRPGPYTTLVVYSIPLDYAATVRCITSYAARLAYEGPLNKRAYASSFL